jgi:hypothetical protein
LIGILNDEPSMVGKVDDVEMDEGSRSSPLRLRRLISRLDLSIGDARGASRSASGHFQAKSDAFSMHICWSYPPTAVDVLAPSAGKIGG